MRPAFARIDFQEIEDLKHVLIVDDDVDSAQTLRALSRSPQTTVAVAHTLMEAHRQIALQQPDIILLDLLLPDGNGMALLDTPELLAHCEVILVTGHASLDTSIQALRMGAADYLVKPIDPAHLQRVLSRFMKPSFMMAEVEQLHAGVAKNGNFGHLWGRSSQMLTVYEQISRVASTSVSVFITGESGTGKELVAQTVHELSRRRKQPFLGVNCGAISPNLFESEIFGHEKGSFTGAERQHIGFFERASGGTLFLDEITEMPLELQVKLLRVLETGRFTRVGSTLSTDADVRVIAASNRPIAQAVASGRLREDLLYRLNVFPIELPPLRERLDDVPLLAEHFLSGISASEGIRKRFTPEALKQLVRYRWPGNVRELRNAVHRAFVMAPGDLIEPAWLPHAPAAGAATNEAPATAQRAAAAPPNGTPAEALDDSRMLRVAIGTSMAEIERIVILETLRHYNHHKERVAAVLGISLKTLYNRLKEYAAESGDARND
jgi:DNA-binding NtrC family response regulator